MWEERCLSCPCHLERIGTAHGHEIGTVDMWISDIFFFVVVTHLAFPLVWKTQMTEKVSHPATLTILGSKVCTCFRRAFMVFPVSTMALGKGRAKEKGQMRRDGRGTVECGMLWKRWKMTIWPTNDRIKSFFLTLLSYISLKLNI